MSNLFGTYLSVLQIAIVDIYFCSISACIFCRNTYKYIGSFSTFAIRIVQKHEFICPLVLVFTIKNFHVFAFSCKKSSSEYTNGGQLDGRKLTMQFIPFEWILGWFFILSILYCSFVRWEFEGTKRADFPLVLHTYADFLFGLSFRFCKFRLIVIGLV